MTDTQRGRHCANRRPVTPLTLAARAAGQKATMVGRGSAMVVASSSLIVGSVLLPSGAVAESPADSSRVNAEAGSPVSTAPAVVVSDAVVWSDDATTLKVKAAKPEQDAADDQESTPTPAAAPTSAPRTTQPSRSAQRSTRTTDSNIDNADESASNQSATSSSADDDSKAESAKKSKKSSKKSTKSSKDSDSKSASDAIDMADPVERGAAIVEIAKRYIGVPYVAGGATPAGFDCSGFTSYVYDKLGIDLPRSSGSQRYAGKVISASKAVPGDIVWSPGHVAIYLGNGRIIDAPRPGKSVQIRSMYQSNPVYIRIAG